MSRTKVPAHERSCVVYFTFVCWLTIFEFVTNGRWANLAAAALIAPIAPLLGLLLTMLLQSAAEKVANRKPRQQ